MNDIDQKIARAEQLLKNLKAQRKAKSAKPKKQRRKKPGRPPIDDRVIAKARELAKNHPIADVAMSLEVSVSTLYERGIKRYVLNKEKEQALE